MRYKILGKDKVPVIGQGTQGIHDPDIIRRGVNLGMTFIDTAEVYKNEEIIGQAIKGIRDKVFIASKFSPEHSGYDDVIKACEGSLKRLGTDYLDLYQLHWHNPAVPLEETMRALNVLKGAGKIKHIGLCNMSHQQIEGLDIDSIQAEYNLFDRSNESLFGHCEKHNILFIAYSPLEYLYNLNPDKMIWFAEIAFKYGLRLSQLALNWIISRKAVITIPKSKDPEHQKINAISSDFTLPPEDYDEIDRLFAFEVSYINPELIKITKTGKFPQTLQEALDNKLNFCPSPVDMAKDLIDIKPVRIVPVKDRFELIEGGLRYWAWVIKYGDKPVPALIKGHPPILE